MSTRLKAKMLLLCSVALGLIFAPAARADRYVVAPGAHMASPQAPYDSWATAATNIQVAVNAASAGETIWVSNGTYRATGAGTNLLGTNMVYIATNVILRSVNGPDVTILDGGYPDITNRVIALNYKAALYGFSVANGCAGRGGGILIASYGGTVSNCLIFSNICDKALGSDGGGGIASHVTTDYTGYFYNCSIYDNTAISNNGAGGWLYGSTVMRNCEFCANTSLYSGGGCYFQGDITVSQCVFSNNTAMVSGGGVYLHSGEVSFDDCLILTNTAKAGGGVAVQNSQANVIISNCTISDNAATSGGGGCFLGASVQYCKIVRCNISSNHSSKYGGGLDIRKGNVLLTDCLVLGNSAESRGGGINYASAETNVAEIMNCVIRDNTSNSRTGGGGAFLGGVCRMLGCLVASNAVTSTFSDSAGGGIRIYSDGVVCGNNTVVSNEVQNGSGGGIYMSAAGQVNNTIIYGNTSRAGLNQDWGTTGVGTFTNCCTADITDIAGSGNIAADPEFVDAVEGNYRLSAASPCVNAGLNQDWMANGVDNDGRPRLDRFTKLVDIGCYEHLFNGAMFFFK